MEEFLYEKMWKSFRWKNMLFSENECGLTYRAINGEGDGLPGLIIDRFKGAWVIEAHAKWVEKYKLQIANALKKAEKEVFLGVKNPIVYRADTRSADLEAIDKKTEILEGQLGEVFAVEHGLDFPVDPLGGQKTGFFFDQRANRTFLKKIVQNDPLTKEKSAIDICCHLGAWGIGLAQAGYKKVVFFDRSEKSLEIVKQVIERNKLSGEFSFVAEDIDSLKSCFSKREFNLVNIDPPALIQSKRTVAQGIKVYENWNRLAITLLKEQGIFSSSSCSYHLFYEKFEELISRCFLEFERTGKLIYRGYESPDHSIVPEMREGRYLKNLIFKMD